MITKRSHKDVLVSYKEKGEIVKILNTLLRGFNNDLDY